MAAAENNLRRIFDDESSDNDEFEGFDDGEIGKDPAGEDSGSEPEFVDGHEEDSEDDSDGYSADESVSWVECAAGDEIHRRSEIPVYESAWPDQADAPDHADIIHPCMDYAEIPTELDCFMELFSLEMLQIMVLQTNLYAEQWQNRVNLEAGARVRSWVDTNVNEMKAFLALRIAMGLAPRNQAGDYFSKPKTWWLTETPNFSKVMSCRRFETLTMCLHFVNNDDKLDRKDVNYNPLFKIQPLFDVVVENWANAVDPGKHNSADESMTPFTGRVSFRQYIKSKHHRYGVKAFALCDAMTSYCIKYDIYTGGYYHYNRELGQGCSVIQKLVRDMPKGTILYTDSFYTSPILATKLMQMGVGLCGTVGKKRKGMPEHLKGKPTREAKFVFKDPILAVSFKDRNDVRMLSTVHGTNMYERETRASAKDRRNNLADEQGMIQTRIPFLTCVYNQFMRGVDGLDQLASYNVYPHRSRKWYIKLFNYILDITLINARILLELQTKTRLKATAFRQALVDQLLEPYLRANNIDPTRAAAHQRPVPDDDQRLEGQHWFEHQPNNTRKRCVLCKTRSQYFCTTCEGHPSICLDPCFKLLHTMENPEYNRPAKQRRVV